jgi:hypothetical protein
MGSLTQNNQLIDLSLRSAWRQRVARVCLNGLIVIRTQMIPPYRSEHYWLLLQCCNPDLTVAAFDCVVFILYRDSW